MFIKYFKENLELKSCQNNFENLPILVYNTKPSTLVIKKSFTIAFSYYLL